MQIYNETQAVKYDSGYFVVYERKMRHGPGKLGPWAILGTWANPPAVWAHLVPLWKESRIQASKPRKMNAEDAAALRKHFAKNKNKDK